MAINKENNTINMQRIIGWECLVLQRAYTLLSRLWDLQGREGSKRVRVGRSRERNNDFQIDKAVVHMTLPWL